MWIESYCIQASSNQWEFSNTLSSRSARHESAFASSPPVRPVPQRIWLLVRPYGQYPVRPALPRPQRSEVEGPGLDCKPSAHSNSHLPNKCGCPVLALRWLGRGCSQLSSTQKPFGGGPFEPVFGLSGIS